jgi:pimeloyl-ACP methyl ester carboxylesterase
MVLNGSPDTIVLIHGLWMSPRSWSNFKGFYKERGYRVFTPAWPRIRGEGDDVRRNPSTLNGLGIAEISDHYSSFVRALPKPPILVGHSFGGLVVQLLLDRGMGAAGIVIGGVVPKGVWKLPWSAIRSAGPALLNPLNYGRSVALTLRQFRYAFANPTNDAEACEAYERYAIPGPGRVVFEQVIANFNPWAPQHSEPR